VGRAARGPLKYSKKKGGPSGRLFNEGQIIFTGIPRAVLSGMPLHRLW